MQRGDENKSCRGNLVPPQSLKIWIRISGQVSLSNFVFLFFRRSFPGQKWIGNQILLKVEVFLLIRILNIKRVQLVKEFLGFDKRSRDRHFSLVHCI